MYADDSMVIVGKLGVITNESPGIVWLSGRAEHNIPVSLVVAEVFQIFTAAVRRL